MPYSATLAKLRNDKELDVIVVRPQSRDVIVLPGNGDGSFQSQSYRVGKCPQSVISADFNNDNKQDLVVVDNDYCNMRDFGRDEKVIVIFFVIITITFHFLIQKH